ncbi:hypothetical protein BaRGS_00024409 [Batillaria attramentaria]|uniref:Uncharacterized protein n=1 Tax=Batillaria attramentaria TaxID=370345 RepID=A0ABD0KAY4_9CAEN
MCAQRGTKVVVVAYFLDTLKTTIKDELILLTVPQGNSSTQKTETYTGSANKLTLIDFITLVSDARNVSCHVCVLSYRQELVWQQTSFRSFLLADQALLSSAAEVLLSPAFTSLPVLSD